MKLYYQTHGNPNNQCILFLHGFLGEGSDFDFLFDAFSDNYFLLIPDLPASGTKYNDDFDNLSFDLIADSINELFAELNINNTVLVGYSLGSRTGFYTYRKYKNLFKALFLESINPGIQDEAEKKQRREKDASLAELIQKQGMKAFLEDWYALPMFKNLDYKTLIERALNFNPKHAQQVLCQLSPGVMPCMIEDFKNLNIPTLLLTGTEDPAFHHHSVKLYEHFNHLSHIQVEGAGHNVHLEQPEAYKKILKDFLEQ